MEVEWGGDRSVLLALHSVHSLGKSSRWQTAGRPALRLTSSHGTAAAASPRVRVCIAGDALTCGDDATCAVVVISRVCVVLCCCCGVVVM